MGGDLQLDIARIGQRIVGLAHAKAPWTNQLMGPVMALVPSPRR
jgi:hypothetical protein